MPKASKARFNKARITEQLDAWKKAALDLEKMGKRAFRSIRSYIPKHEAALTNAQKSELVDIISKLGIIFLLAFLL